MFKQNFTNTSNVVLKRNYRLLLSISILGIIAMVGLIAWQLYSDKTTDDNINVAIYAPIILGPIATCFSLWADSYGKELKKRKAEAQ